MATTQASKRRKTEHVSSSEEDNASFASFSDTDEQHGDVEDMPEDEGTTTSNGLMAEDGADEVEREVMGDAFGAEYEQSTEGASEEFDSEAALDDQDGSRRGASEVPQRVVNSAAVRKRASESNDGAHTAGTFKSNVFKLQVDELLGQIRPKRGRKEASAEEALHEIKKAIEQIPASRPVSVGEAERSLLSKKVAVPFPNPRPPKDAKYKFEYAKPANINVVGSYPLKTAPNRRGDLELDMVVQMPASLFQDKDYLNYRYFYKRAYYIAHIAAGLEGHHEFNMRFISFSDDPLKPVLAVTPKQSSANGAEEVPTPMWQVNIIPSIAPGVFVSEKLAPDRNCVRTSAPDVDTSNPQATPFYNSSLRADMLVTPYLKLLHSATSSCPAFRDACLLGSTWLRQRGFDSSINAGGFGTFEWSVLMALLLQGGGPAGRSLLSEGYSSYQLLKATLQLIAMKDLAKQSLVIGEDTVTSPRGGAPVVWDGNRKHNLLYKSMPWSYKFLRQEARTTLSMLGDQFVDGFESTFILRTNQALLRYDYLVEIERSSLTSIGARGDHKVMQRQCELYEVLSQGLSDRVSLTSISETSGGPWELGSAKPRSETNGLLTVGMVVNPDNVNRAVDHGPSAESKAEAAAFRKFWGEKAELRRFKDGSILESLIWSVREGDQPILEQIVRYLLGKHFSPAAEQNAVFVGEHFGRMLRHSASQAPFQPLTEAYKQMENDIRNLDGLPLAIRQIMPADARLRFASINAPPPSNGKQRPVPADVTLQFEGSARWPDALVAIQRTKIAFLLKLSQLLQDSVEAVSTRVGLENEEHDILNQAYLDIGYDSGAAFRLRIHHDREQALLERQLKDKNLDPRSKEDAALALATYKRDYIKSPAHTQAIARLCNRYPALSGTLRLTKKWFASHLLNNHVAEEVIEMLVARTFVQPWPWQTSFSVQTGFLRTLFWLSRWDWRADPLIVDLSGSGELKQADVSAIRTRFEAWRKLDPAMNRVVLFAASNVDQDGTTWTDGRAVKVVAGRMTALARAAVAEIEAKGMGLEPASLFVSPLNDYDFVLHLNSDLAGAKRKKGSKHNTTYKNLELDALSDTGVTSFDLVTDFLRELEDLYGSAILFFSGGSERPVIAGLWSPQTAPRVWKVNLAYSTIPLKKEEEVEARINKEATLAEIARLGGEIVERVEVNR